MIGADGVERHAGIDSLPDQPLQCFSFGHRWEPGPVTVAPGWGAQVWEVVARCACGRVRGDVLAPATGALLSRTYTGGHGLDSRLPADRETCRWEWVRRTRARAAGAADLGSARRRKRGA